MALIDQIIAVESGGDPNARNPRSSASGPSQFIDSTWLSMLAKHRPDITGSPQELLALKSNPELSRAMTEAYAADNSAMLSKAGHQVTPGTTYLAHFSGPQGAVSVLNADPSTPVARVLGEGVVRANPFLAKMTAGDLRAWADKKMGGKSAAPSAPVLPPPPPIFAQASQAPQPMGQSPSSVNDSARAMMASRAAAPQQAPSLMEQFPAAALPAPPPIYAPPRRPIDLSKLRAALEASGNRGRFF